jgi:hypothetical protein
VNVFLWRRAPEAIENARVRSSHSFTASKKAFLGIPDDFGISRKAVITLSG